MLARHCAVIACCAVFCVAVLLLVSPGVLGLQHDAHKRILVEGVANPNSDAQRTFVSELKTAIPALVICLSVGAIATAAGVGGGPIFVPIFSVLAGFSVKAATALSQATITGGAIAGVALSLRRRSPVDPSEPILDFPLALMLTPMLLLGVAIGVLGNNLLPTWLITLLLIVLLFTLAYHTLRKAIKLHHKEKKAKAGRAGDAGPKPGQGLPQVQEKAAVPVPAPEPARNGADSHAAGPTRNGVDLAAETGVEAESATCVIELADAGGTGDRALSEPAHPSGERTPGEGETGAVAAADEVPTRPNTALVALQATETVLMWGGFLALQIAKTRFNRCTGAYGGLFAAEIVLAVGTSTVFAWQALHRRRAQAASHLKQPMLSEIYGSQPLWTPLRLFRAALIALVGGIVAGLFGIGGGMIMGPLLLEFGLHPMVSAATSGLMVLFSSSIAAFSFGFDHLLNTQFALIFGLGCFGASLLGVLLVARVVKRSGKASIVVFLLAMVIGIGAILTAIFGGRDAILILMAHRNLGFGSFCSKSSS